jgi:hypothetical protein
MAAVSGLTYPNRSPKCLLRVKHEILKVDWTFHANSWQGNDSAPYGLESILDRVFGSE